MLYSVYNNDSTHQTQLCKKYRERQAALTQLYLVVIRNRLPSHSPTAAAATLAEELRAVIVVVGGGGSYGRPAH